MNLLVIRLWLSSHDTIISDIYSLIVNNHNPVRITRPHPASRRTSRCHIPFLGKHPTRFRNRGPGLTVPISRTPWSGRSGKSSWPASRLAKLVVASRRTHRSGISAPAKFWPMADSRVFSATCRKGFPCTRFLTNERVVAMHQRHRLRKTVPGVEPGTVSSSSR
jgi:hypothetical protein